MNDLSRPGSAWNAIFVLSLIAIGIIGWYAVHLPDTSGTALASAKRVRVATLNEAKYEASRRMAVDKMIVARRTWAVSPDLLGSQALGVLEGLAGKAHLTLADFRTDPPAQIGKITEVPIAVVVEGTFPDVMSFVDKLEDPESKLALTMLQVAASDPRSDKVSATLELAGFPAMEGE